MREKLDGAVTELTRLVDAALEESRTVVVERLTSLGFPLSIVDTRLEVVRNSEGNGWQGEHRHQQVSGLSDLAAMAAILDREARPTMVPANIGAALSPLCAFIENNSTLAVAGGSGLMPASIGRDGLVKYVLAPLVLHYLQSLADLSVPNPELVVSLAVDLAGLIDRGNFEATVRQLAISGIVVERRYEALGVSIRPLTPEEKGRYLDGSRQGAPEPGWHRQGLIVPAAGSTFMPTSLLEADTLDGSGQGSEHAMERFVLACILDGYPVSTSGTSVGFHAPVWCARGLWMTPFPIGDRHLFSESVMTAEAFARTAQVFQRIPHSALEGVTREGVVFGRILIGNQNSEPSLLDFVTSLESALLQGVRSELAFRFALYGALYLSDRLPPEATFEDLKAVYGVRSKVVHGTPVKLDEVRAAAQNAKKYAETVALKIVDSDWPNHKLLNRMALATSLGR